MIKAIKKILKGFISPPAAKLPEVSSLNFTSMDLEKALNKPENNHYRELLKKINLVRSKNDEMFDGDGAYYLQVGLSAIQCIEAAISESKVNTINQILDMPCGHGRVLRFIAQYFPGTEITACDTDTDAVEFCKIAFGAHPVYSTPNLNEFNTGKKYDLIWCGSLATHFDSDNTKDLLSFFYRHLNIGGLLVFSMHGRKVLENLRTKKITHSLNNESIEKILSETEQGGYGYADYTGVIGYGISIASPAWVKDTLDKTGNWRDYRHAESAWIHYHDIYSVVKE